MFGSDFRLWAASFVYNIFTLVIRECAKERVSTYNKDLSLNMIHETYKYEYPHIILNAAALTSAFRQISVVALQSGHTPLLPYTFQFISNYHLTT
jgi:hypothetical protein